MGLRAWDVARLLLVLGVVVGGFLLAPNPQAEAAEPLPPGSYVVAVDEVSFALWVGEDGDVVVTGATGLVVELQRDDRGRVLDRFTVARSGGERFSVEIDASRGDLYLTSVELLDAPDESEEPRVAVRGRDDRTTPPTHDGDPLFDPGPNPMADRVNGVAEALVRGADGVRDVARGLGDLVDPRDEGPAPARPATPAEPAEPARPGDDQPATPATPARPAEPAGGQQPDDGDTSAGDEPEEPRQDTAEGRAPGTGDENGNATPSDGRGRDR